jgi:hypothetical protein
MLRKATLAIVSHTLFCRYMTNNPSVEGGSIVNKLAILLFMVVGGQKATDPRDRLYGILGICEGPGNFAHDAALTPNYKKPVAVVFKDLAKYLIVQRGSLDILCGAHETIDGLPSWVPSWGSQTSGNHLGRYFVPENGEIKGSNLMAQFHFLEDDNVLRVKGVELARIGILGRQANLQQDGCAGTGIFPRVRTLFKDWEEIIIRYLLAQNRFTTSKDAKRAWKFALMHDIKDGKMEEEQKVVELLTYEAIVGRMELGNAGMERMAKEIAFDRYKKVEFQYPFCTTSSHMGFSNEGGELQPKIGDLICLLAGGPVPFILRKEGDKYRFLGACYLRWFSG